MDFTIKSQLSALILTALMNKDLYGLEIIQDVLQRSNGDVTIKQPSLYSNLKRMEANGYITSYWRDSTIGGNRHYYSVTDLGRKLYNEMQLEIFATQRRMRKVINPEATEKTVSSSPTAAEEVSENIQEKQTESEKKNSESERFTVLEQQSLFTQKNSQEKPNKIHTESKKQQTDQVQYDMFSAKPEIDPSKNDAVLYDREGRILNKPMRMTLDEPVDIFPNRVDAVKRIEPDLEAKEEPQQKEEPTIQKLETQKIEEPKTESSIIEEPIMPSVKEESPAPVTIEKNITEPIYPKEILKDDAVLITERYEKTNQDNKNQDEEDQGVFITMRPGDSDLPKVKKIEPANLDIYAKTTGKNMPEPVKETMYHSAGKKGNYSQLISSLYNRSTSREKKEESFTSYKQLSAYYAEKGIWFKEYSKAAKERTYKTNKIHFLRSFIIFVLTCLLTAGSYFLFSELGHIKAETSFVYIIPPCIAVLLMLYYGYQWIFTQSKPPKKPWSIYLSIGLWVLVTAIILAAHIYLYSTLSLSDMLIRANTLLFPCIIFAIVPINTLIAGLLYKKLKF